MKEVVVGKQKGEMARTITAARRMKVVMMMVIMACHRSSRSLEGIAGSLDSHTFLFVSLPVNCALSLLFFCI